MALAEFKNLATQETRNGIDFGGPKTYLVGDIPVYAPEGGTNITYADDKLTLEPLGLTTEAGDTWEKISTDYAGDGTWTITIQNIITGEIISGIYEFKDGGNYYTTRCDSTPVSASCGGYKVEDTWDDQQPNEWKKLLHTDDTLPHEILSYNCPYPKTLIDGSCIQEYGAGWELELTGPGAMTAIDGRNYNPNNQVRVLCTAEGDNAVGLHTGVFTAKAYIPEGASLISGYIRISAQEPYIFGGYLSPYADKFLYFDAGGTTVSGSLSLTVDHPVKYNFSGLLYLRWQYSS